MLKKALFYLLAVLVGATVAVVGNIYYQEERGGIANIIEDADIYYFYSDYCHYCQQVKPYIEVLAEKYEIKFCNVAEMDENCSKISSSLNIKYVPTLVISAEEKDYVFVGYKEVMDVINTIKGLK